MNWKNLKLSKKFTVSFGIVILLLAFTAFWAINGIGGILLDAEEVVGGNKLKAELEDKYVQHLQWAHKVNELLTNEEVSELKVQTDPTKCNFGVWYYGEGRKQAELLVPELKTTFDEMEVPHKHLHESAIKINDVFEQLDWEVAINLRQSKLDHINWLNTVKDAIYI